MQQMQISSTPPKTLEYVPTCRMLSMSQFVVFGISFAVTWYHAWWDSTIGLFVALYGIYTTWGSNPISSRVQWMYNLNIASMASHIIALCVILYYVVEAYLIHDVIHVDKEVHVDRQGSLFYGFLFAVLTIEFVLTAFTIFRVQQLTAEMCRNGLWVNGNRLLFGNIV